MQKRGHDPGITAGTGVHVYVLDTGIKSAHAEFRQLDQHGHIMDKSRVSPIGFSYDDSSLEDCEGHGTHVAAIIGGQW